MKMEKALWFGSVAALLALGTACNDTSLASAPVSGAKPTAVISGVQEYGPLDTATFDGSASFAVDPKTITAYEWSISARPSGSTSLVQPLGAGSQVDFFVDVAGDYKIKLKVTDTEGLTDATEYAFSAVPSQSLHVELTWQNQYTQADMDLHLINKSSNGSFDDSTRDCYYSNCKPDGFGQPLDWGVSGNQLDDPTLDIDNITDSVPENINIKKPASGVYQVAVHYFASHASSGGDIPVDCHVKIYLDGAVGWEGDMHFTAANQVWNVGDVTWAGGQGSVTPNGNLGTTTGF